MLPLLLLLFSSDDAWVKVLELKSGQEIRVYQKGSVQPLEAKFGDATDDNLVVIVKDEQKAIAKESIDRVDARPQQKESRVKKEEKWTANDPKVAGPNGSYSSGLSIGGKPGFETVYRRPMKKPAP